MPSWRSRWASISWVARNWVKISTLSPWPPAVWASSSLRSASALADCADGRGLLRQAQQLRSVGRQARRPAPATAGSRLVAAALLPASRSRVRRPKRCAPLDSASSIIRRISALMPS